METRANYVVVGVFTLVAIVAAFAFIYWTAAIGDRGETTLLRVRIPGSASGLGRGSAVLFNGVKVGDVTRVYIDVTNPTVAIADTQIDRLTPITRSTSAVIGIAGLTGQANIEIKGSSQQEPNLLEESEQKGTVAEIIADPSAVTNLLQTAQDIFKRADSVISQLESFTKDVRDPLTQTVKNAETFSESLARNADGVDKFLASVSDLSGEISKVSTKLDGTIQAAQDILKAVDPAKVTAVVDNVDKATQQLAKASDQFDEISDEVKTTVSSINDLAKGAQVTLSKFNGTLDGVDPETVRRILANLDQTTRTANAAAADISRVTSKVAQRADQIDSAVDNAQQMIQRLNAASVRVDGILVKVDNLLGSGETEGLVANANATLKSIRSVADTVNGRIGAVMDGLSNFTTNGLRNVDQLVRDSRRSINRIEETITDLGRNPQRVLSGGDGEPRQYDGRFRR